MKNVTAWKVSKYGAFSGPYFPVFGLNTDTGKYGPEKTPYLNTFLSVCHYASDRLFEWPHGWFVVLLSYYLILTTNEFLLEI